jgi:hypothetical protein
MTLPESGWKGHGRPGYQCAAINRLRDMHAEWARLHMQLDLAETRRHRGTYIAPDVPAATACEVALALETIAMEGRK